MSFGPQVVMPGAFHYDGPSNDAAPISGVHPGLFRQPVSPSPSSSVYLGSSLYSDASTSLASNVKRKRQAGRESTPLNEWTIADDLGTSMTSSAGGRKPDLGTRKISGGRRKYILAGQINTPTGGSGNNGAEQRDGGDCMEDSVYSDIDYRRALGSKRPHADVDATPSSAIPETPKQAGWSTFALQTIGGVVGGVVGKVWEFCKAGAFRGFYAGGGKGYDMPAPAPTATMSPAVPMPTTNPTRNSGQGQIWCNEHDVPTYPAVASGPPAPISSTPYYYEREVPIESVPTSFSHAPQQPAAKRRQINGGLGGMQGRDELRRNWVVVNNDENNNNSNNNNNNKRPSAFTSRAPVMVRSYYKDPPRPPPRNNLFNRNYGPNRAGTSHGLNTTHAFGVAARPSTPKLSNASMAGSSGGTSPTPREPASYASPRSSPVAPTPTLAPVHTAPSPVPAPQLSPSRIPVPVAPGGSRPHSPATRIASPSPSPSPHPHPSSSAAARRRLGSSAHSSARRRSQGVAGSGRPGSAAGGAVRRRESSVSDLGGHGHSHSNSSKARLDREAQKLAARRLQAEREADLRITDFNARLREMIRQGREALGTSVEVDVLGGGDGGGGGGDIWEDD